MTDTFEREVYDLLYKNSVLSEGNIGVRILHEDMWPVDEIKALVSKTVLECLPEIRTCCPYDPVEDGYNACLSTIKTNLQEKGVV